MSNRSRRGRRDVYCPDGLWFRIKALASQFRYQYPSRYLVERLYEIVARDEQYLKSNSPGARPLPKFTHTPQDQQPSSESVRDARVGH